MDTFATVQCAPRTVHLDVKPDNILLRPSAHGMRSIRLIDFGFSESLRLCVRTSVMTTANSVVTAGHRHSPGYAAPEQQGGEGQRSSDVYAMGASLKIAATYVPPFGKANRDQVTFRIAKGAHWT